MFKFQNSNNNKNNSSDVKSEKTSVVIYKQGGKFYDVYGYDALIFNLLFDFKILKKETSKVKTIKCGFPDNSLARIVNKLDEKKISYQIMSRDKDPVVKDYKKINNYLKYKDDALKKNDIEVRLDLLLEKIKSLSHEDAVALLEKIEECLK